MYKNESPTVPRNRVKRSNSLIHSSHSRRSFTQAPRSAALFQSGANAGEVVFLSPLLPELSQLCTGFCSCWLSSRSPVTGSPRSRQSLTTCKTLLMAQTPTSSIMQVQQLYLSLIGCAHTHAHTHTGKHRKASQPSFTGSY